mgnify:CR=1 FL=1
MEFQHELIIPNEGLPFKVFLFEGGNGNYVREKHWHTSIEIFAVLEGHLEFFMNKEEYPLKAGEQMIINSNEIHSIRAVEKNKTVVLQIPLKQFENYFTAQRFIRFRSQDEAADVKLASLIKKLYKVYTARDVGYEFRTMSLFYEIMYMLVKNYRLTEVHEKEIRHSRRLDALSFGYSDAYLSRMFQKYAKVNYKTYLQDIRMAYAYRDLMNTDRTISQIALDNGFCSSRGFSGEFQKRYGILPSEMRKEIKQKGQKSAIE